MDRFAYLIDSQHRFLLFGIVILIMVGMSVLSGDVLEPRNRFVERAEEPKRFWQNVLSWLALAVFFIGLYLYQRAR